MQPAKTERIKSATRKLMPDAIYGRAAAVWHLRHRVVWALKYSLEHGWPKTLVHFGIAPGDDLICTAVLRELKKRGHKKLWMMSNYAELFQGNQDVDHVVPVDQCFQDYTSIFGGKRQLLEYASIDHEKDLSIPPQRHIIAEMCLRAGIKGRIVLRPYFHLNNEENVNGVWAEEMIAIQSSGLGGILQMQNKQWFPERFQEIVNRLKGRFKFFQIGSSSDPALDGVTDLRGKTRIRETASLLANCRLYVGNVGFLMHLARAVECPSVIIYGGREAPWQSGYTGNINLYSALPCAPCWLWNTCEYDRLCMQNISADDVIQAIERVVSHPRNPLPEEGFEL